jgi:serine/threonine protein kinase/tetratricopeptide (TPR) repeat protein
VKESMTLSSGTKLGRYEIRSQLGAGGMGEVYLALDTELDRTVAIKILPEALAADQQRLQRFIQEAKAASALNHPHILTIHEIGTAGSLHFIATEFIDGDTLRQRMSAGMKLSEILEISTQAAGALAAAHAAGIVHRDIKPENIMVRRDGYIKLLDFGLAKVTEARASLSDPEAPTKAMVNTSAGTVLGTANYMSPEQAKGTNVDARSDLWSLGAVLYEMVTGRVPFAGETPTETISLILQREPAPLTRFAQDVPGELVRIVNKALTKDCEERYQTARDLLIDLRSLKRKLEIDAEIDRTMPPDFRVAMSTSGGHSAPATVSGRAGAPTLVGTPHAASNAEYIVSSIKQHKLASFVAVGITIALIAGLGFYWRARTTQVAIDSIAVLPFENRSSDADTEYLSDGLAESLIYRLSQLPDLKVSPTSSVFRYRGKDIDPIKIGGELGVRAVLSGRITQRGDSLIISAELVDVSNNKLLWGEQYDRKMADLLATQREIAREIYERLRVKVSGQESKEINKNYTENNEAYQLYLKGRYHFAKRTFDDLNRSLDYFQQAINRDPNFALAYAAIADSYNAMPSYPYLSSKEAFPRAKVAAQRALEIDPTLAEAHTALANVLAIYDGNWAEAEREFKRAIELNPNYANAHFYYGLNYLLPLGRMDEAIVELKHAVELEPLSITLNANLAGTYMYARQYDSALEQARKTNDLEQNHPSGKFWLFEAYVAKGMYEEAAALFQKEFEADPTNPRNLYVLGYTDAKAGRRRAAEEKISKLENISKGNYVISYRIARIRAALGQKDEAFALLEKAYQERDYYLPRLKVDPGFDSLHDDPRFADLVRRIGLSQ